MLLHEDDSTWSHFHINGVEHDTVYRQYKDNAKKLCSWKAFFCRFGFHQELRRQWQWLCAITVVSCLLCSCWSTGLITQSETGEPGSDCLREQTLPWTKNTVKHCLFPVTGSSGLVTAPSCYLSSGQNDASTSSPLLSACSVKLAAPARATEDRTPQKSHEWFSPHWKSFCLKTALNEGFPHITSPATGRRNSGAQTGSLQTRPCCFSDHLARPLKKNLNWVRSAVNRPSAGVNLPYFYRPKSKTTNTIMKTERTIWQRHAETLWTCPLCRRRLPPHRDTVHKWADANWTSHLGGQKVPYTIKRSTFKTFQTFFFFFSQNYAHHCILELEI